MANEEIIDSPSGWVAEHIQSYVSTNGEEGFTWNGAQILLLSTRGRRSGKWRRTALIFGESGPDYVIVASKGGAPDNPLWYENLAADGHVRVQIRGEVFDAHARTVTDDAERAALWPIMTAQWPDYDAYQQKTDRKIPVVVLSRA